MNYNKLIITSCAILAALCVTAQNQDMRRGGNGGGVTVAAGDRITAVTNGTVVTLSADVQSGGLFPNGVTNVTITNFSSSATYNGKLVVNASADGASDVVLRNTSDDGIPVGGYIYIQYTSATVGGTVSPDTGVSLTRFGSGLNIGGQNALIKCYKTQTNVWHVEGDLTIP